MKDPNDIVLVPFGPTHPVPAGHKWCFACDGANDGPGCEVCGGKGYHNADDIDRYHAKHPHICRMSCGTEHLR